MGCLSFAACTSGGKKVSADEKPSSPEPAAVVFPLPDVPAMMTDPQERGEFLLVHYWDKFDFADTALVNNRDISEQGFADQLALLAKAPENTAKESLEKLCTGFEVHGHARKVFMQMVDDYLYNPNSPYYNETLYGIYLRRMLASSVLDEAYRTSLQFRLDLISRNRRGTKAEDFTYYLPDGSRNTLYHTPMKGKHLLVVFYDPECQSCHETLRQMIADKQLAEAVSDGRLTVLAVYTEGNFEMWKQTVPEMPRAWIICTDREQVKERALYDLKAMPSLYLLDSVKRVLFKDASFEEVKEKIGTF